MFRFTSQKDNAVAATYQYLKAIGAKVTEETVEETLKNHPDYPSLLATSDALNEWKIENVTVRIKPEQLSELQTPFLTYLYINDGIFVLVKSIKNDFIEWVHTTEGFKREKTDEFLKKWNGVVLMAETNADSGEKNFTENNKKEILSNLRTPVLLLGATLLVISIFYYNFSTNWHYNALLLTKFAGIIVSSLLLWQIIDKNNPFINNLCQAGGKANCNAILSSNAAQVTSWLSWSEVGFFYFVGGFVALLINPNSMFILWGIGSTALFYTFWSIYYQAFVVKQWCTLCLSIQMLFIVEFLLNIQFLWEFNLNFSKLNYSELVAILSAVSGAVLFWIFLKPILQKSQQVSPLKNDLRRFKNNPNLFLSLLQNQAEIPYFPQDMTLFGNPNAEHKLTMVTNPFCQPCAKTHKIVEELLFTNENLKCQVIFSASNHKDDKRGIVARTILSLPKDQQAIALHQWYENEERNIEKWQTQLGSIGNEKTENIIEQHKTFCEVAKVEGTPTLYLDGYKLPQLYRLADLKGILKYLPTADLQINHK
ncbi:peptidase C39 bacteriocin processing (plasmid) [Emticicia oligotrophica DSM 17448]|uniref:Peptidase C39 bacteriocin processing n=1 Tax=Emticicia oligotrophica (strain DSM 17448 / CIP 109782 / MTCC 6937 / GPTSA100-15) TaxID=929562 RepID=A0ABN4AUY3_EMTOG|nr:vitamin K epoxide reductase family protein [Emticicia oligotrophica]AFK05506.1 peptidase C39 bacteriocin processing [Emticicia oligotrophica DSM 17448]